MAYLCRLLISAAVAGGTLAPTFQPNIPRAWDDHEVAGLEVPLVDPHRSPRYLSAAEYYSLEVMPIYRSYPVYARGKEPAGYLEALKQKEPELAFDPSELHTLEDWIRAGEIVFRAAREYQPPDTGIAVNAEAVQSLHIPVNPDGIMPFARYVVRKKGVVELGVVSCAACHTRVLPDGTVVEGAQGNVPFARRDALARINDNRPDLDGRALRLERMLYAAPWVERSDDLFAITSAEQIRRLQATQPGVIAREGTSSAYPVHVPSLIGIKDRRYLDATGLTRQRSIADLMRYAIVNQGFVGGLQVTAQVRRLSARKHEAASL